MVRTAVPLPHSPVLAYPQSPFHDANKLTFLDNISEHVTSFQKDFSSCSQIKIKTILYSAHSLLRSGSSLPLHFPLAPLRTAPLILLSSSWDIKYVVKGMVSGVAWLWIQSPVLPPAGALTLGQQLHLLSDH